MEAFLKNFDLVPLDVLMALVDALLFVVLWKLLQRTLFDPYLKLIEAREAATVKAEEQAASLTEKSDILSLEYERQLTEVRVAALKEKLKALDQAKAQASKVIEQAETKAQEHIRSVRLEIDKEVRDLKSSAEAEVQSIAALLAERVQKVASSPATGGTA
jgi:F0F1-type ATP synthase membrane subunit b/b'